MKSLNIFDRQTYSIMAAWGWL